MEIMKALIKTYRLFVLVTGLLILNQVAFAQLCDITPNKYKGCKGDQFEFSIITPPSSYSSIMWNFGDGDSSNQMTSTITHIFKNNNLPNKPDTFGVFTVTVTLRDAGGNIKCGPKTVQITVYDLPNADLVLPVPSTMCFKGNAFQFMDYSKAGKSGAPIVSRAWDFGDGGQSNQTNPLYSYKTSGAYTIYLQIADTNGCVDTATKVASIIVLPDLQPKFKTTYKISCPTTPVKFDNTTDSNGKAIIDWWWDYGDGKGDSSASNWNTQFTHIYTGDGAFNPKLFIKSWFGCVDSFEFMAGARNIFYWFDIKKSASGPVCWEGNNVCFEQKPRPNAYYWLWTFDDPPSMIFNTDDKTWRPCHQYTAPGFYHITLKIWEPNCIRDTTFCSFIPLKGPMAMIKLPPPAPNSKCGANRRIPVSYFDAFNTTCWNPGGDPVVYTYWKSTAKFVSHIDSFYCNAPVIKIDSVLKPGCDDTVVTRIKYTLGSAQGAVTYYDSVLWYSAAWFPGDPYPWADPFAPVPKDRIYFQPGACNLKNIHDSDQYKFDCRGPNLVFFPNNTVKYRLRYDIDNNAPGYSIPPGKDMSMDKCKNPSYPWGSDSLQYFWDFTDSYGDDCTSTVAKPNVKCKFSTEVAPLHLYKENGCYSPRLTVTDTVTGCISQTSVQIPMEPPDAGWDYNVFKKMAAVGWDTSERRLDYNLQRQMPPSWGRRGFILNGVPCVGQAYPQTVAFNETLPRCARQKWWVNFDSVANCSGYCKDSVWVDTNGDGNKDKLIKTIAVQCGWIDDITYAMMGNKYIYGKGGCKTLGVIIKTGDCFDTFWYHEYKYIADLQAGFDILDPASYNIDSGRYLSTLDYAVKQQLRLCPPFQTIISVRDTTQVGITNFNFTVSKNFAAPWTKPWNASLEDSCKIIQQVSYMICHKDSFFVNPLTKDTTFTYCFMFPNPSLNCGVNQLSADTDLDTFYNMGFVNKDTFNILDLRDTLYMNDTNGNSLFEPGKYAITSVVKNLYNCVNLAQAELFVGHYTDFTASDQIICYEGGGDTVIFNGFVRYFQIKIFPWDPELNPENYWRDPLTPRGGSTPAAPSVTEEITWDLDGDGVYGDGATGVTDSVVWVYTKPGNYTIRMKTTDSNNCVQVLERKDFIQVIGVVADFDTTTGVSVCAPQTVQFVDKSYGLNIYQYMYDRFGNKIDSTAVDTVISWKWDFGDNLGGTRSVSYLKNPIHTYRDNGCYNVSLTVKMENGCIDSITKFKYVCIQGPLPNFEVLDSLGCQPFTVFVKDKSDSSTIGTWEFVKGDATVASFKSRPADSIFSLVYNTPGKFKLYLRASDSVFNSAVGKWITCTQEFAEPSDSLDPHYNITVKPVKTSSFTADTLICSGTYALINDLSDIAYDTIKWNYRFGIDTVFDIRPRGNVNHLYTLDQGVYDKVFTIAMDPSGPDTVCPDVTKYWNIRVVDAQAAVDTPYVRLPKYQFADNSVGGTHKKITIKGIDNPAYFVEYNYPEDYVEGNKVNHNFLNDTGSFEVCEITWIERNGLNGCPDTACITVINEFLTNIDVPNIFTPGNADGINDLFEIYSQGVEKWEITIMNRWGEKVFTSTNPDDHWNGKRMNTGADCAAGVYYFIINYQLRGQDEDSKSGSVTLIR
jgi:gliding motility-associated-like protein